MNNQSQQTLPSPQSIARFTDQKTIDILSSHNVFAVGDLLKMLPGEGLDIHLSSFQFRIEAANLIGEMPEQGESKKFFLDKMENLVKKYGCNMNKEISQTLLDGVDCTLLEPNGKGWQKGSLKLCFEFIPEEDEPIATKEDVVKTTQSPLDEIRQLANNLPIDQN